MASLYLDGTKEICYKGFLCGGEYLANWKEFMKALYMRFDSRDAVEEPRLVVQDAAAKALLDEFEEFFSEPTQLPLARTLRTILSGVAASVKEGTRASRGRGIHLYYMCQRTRGRCSQAQRLWNIQGPFRSLPGLRNSKFRMLEFCMMGPHILGIYHEIGHFSQLNEISPEFVVAQIHELKVLIDAKIFRNISSQLVYFRWALTKLLQSLKLLGIGPVKIEPESWLLRGITLPGWSNYQLKQELGCSIDCCPTLDQQKPPIAAGKSRKDGFRRGLAVGETSKYLISSGLGAQS
ncbi:hypothetical protein NC651_005791 [Populus alba x Populus x berolinensis]|nr:hypothetical protein NC651_005791 [Populus alba x Populus x berolinensis]